MSHDKQKDEKQPSAGDASGKDMKPVGMPKDTSQPKPESTAEYEGSEDRAPTGNDAVEVKVETSSSSGE